MSGKPKPVAPQMLKMSRGTDLPLGGPRMRPLVEVYFSPDGGAEEAVIEEINQAEKSLFVMAYYLTDKQIIEAMTEAVKRRVVVMVIIDDHGDNSPHLKGLWEAGALHWVDKKHSIMHNKVIVVDDHTVVTGSYNFSTNADERNAENLLILRSRTLAEVYRKNWFDHWGHSRVKG